MQRSFNGTDAQMKETISSALSASRYSAMAIAAELGRGDRWLYKAADKNDQSTFLSVHDLAPFTAMTDTTLLELLCMMCGGVYVPLPACASPHADRPKVTPSAPEEDLKDAALSAAKEMGDVVAAVQETLADGRATSDERRRVVREALENMAALSAIVALMREMKQEPHQ